MRKILLLMPFLFASIYVSAQIDPSMGTPPQPTEYGKCYAKCWIPDRYEQIEERVQVSGGETTSKITPASYNTSSERVMIQEAATKYIPVPAVYETTTKKVLVKEGACNIKFTPAQYDAKTTQKLVKEATGKWERKLKAPNCLSDNPDDCYILCWVEVPAVYEYDVEMVLLSPEKYDTVYTDAQYETITVKRVKTPATYKIEEIPAKYADVTVKTLDNCEGVETFTTDAKYKTTTRKVLVSPGKYMDWVEVVCDVDIDASLISKVQQKLHDLGYSAGTPDGILGANTKRALEKYQTDNGLPVGNLNIATMEKMGVR